MEFNLENLPYQNKRAIIECRGDERSVNLSNWTSRTDKRKIQNAQKRQKTLQGYVDFCDHKRAEHINQIFSKFLVGCALPFTISGSVFFIDYVRSLNSAYVKHLPHVETFRMVYIQRLFDDNIKELSAIWKSSNNPVLTMAFHGFKGETLHTMIMWRNLLMDIVHLKHVLIPVRAKNAVSSTLASLPKLSKTNAKLSERK